MAKSGMSHDNTKQRQKGMAYRQLLSLLVVCWVSLGLQPCAVASVHDAECPHCPSEETHAMPNGHDHSAMAADADCATAVDSCCDLDETIIDSGKSQTSVDDLDGKFIAISLQTTAYPQPLRARLLSNVDPPEYISPPKVPLHILHCVYRD